MNIGDIVYVDDKEFMIVSYSITKDHLGISINIHGKDPLLAQATKDQCNTQLDLIKKSFKVLTKLEENEI